MNWYKKQIKKSWNAWEPLSDTISNGFPSTGNKKRTVYPESGESMTQPNPFLGQEVRGIDHHKGTSSFNNDLSENGKIRTNLPGEDTLMENRGNSTGLNGEEFKADGDFRSYREEDGRDLGGISKEIDKGPVGPHNMQNRSIYQKYKKVTKIPTFNNL